MRAGGDGVIDGRTRNAFYDEQTPLRPGIKLNGYSPLRRTDA